MKSNCDMASMATPSRVEMAPWTTGENTGSNVITARLLREEPIDVKNVYNNHMFVSISTKCITYKRWYKSHYIIMLRWLIITVHRHHHHHHHHQRVASLGNSIAPCPSFTTLVSEIFSLKDVDIHSQPTMYIQITTSSDNKGRLKLAACISSQIWHPDIRK